MLITGLKFVRLDFVFFKNHRKNEAQIKLFSTSHCLKRMFCAEDILLKSIKKKLNWKSIKHINFLIGYLECYWSNIVVFVEIIYSNC